MQEKSILGVDVSKSKIDVCLIVGEKIRHKLFDNNHKAFAKLVDWCTGQGASFMHVCMEATGHYMEDIAHYMNDLGYIVSIINPSQIKNYTKTELLRGKTDKSDAQAIAWFCLKHNPKAWIPQAKEERVLRDLLRCMDSLKKHKIQLHNRLENDKDDKIARNHLSKVIKSIEEEIEQIMVEINDHLNTYPDLMDKVKLISQIKGIGKLTSCFIIAEMPNTDNFKSAKEFAAYAGLTPGQHRSGSSVYKKSRICKIGSNRARKALYMPALVVKNHNKYFKFFCDRLISRGKAGKVVVVALMRKLLHVIYGMLKSKENFNPDLI